MLMTALVQNGESHATPKVVDGLTRDATKAEKGAHKKARRADAQQFAARIEASVAARFRTAETCGRHTTRR